MQHQNFTHTGLLKTTENHIKFLLLMEYYLIMKVNLGGIHLLQEKYHYLLLSTQVLKRVFYISEI